MTVVRKTIIKDNASVEFAGNFQSVDLQVVAPTTISEPDKAAIRLIGAGVTLSVGLQDLLDALVDQGIDVKTWANDLNL